jgi:hypothetical protein
MALGKERKGIAAPLNLDLSKLPLEEPEGGVYATYSNMVNLDWTTSDLRLRFAELMQVPSDEDRTWVGQHLVILEKALVTIPWHQAKILCNLLAGVIRSYEDLNGELKPIRVPAGPVPESAATES